MRIKKLRVFPRHTGCSSGHDTKHIFRRPAGHISRRPDGFLLAGLIITGLILFLTFAGVFLTPYEPSAMSVDKFSPPSLAHWMGTDQFGRDIFARVAHGSGATLMIALSVVATGASGGILIGALTGYFGGTADELLMRLCDTLTAFPSILLALVMVSLTGAGNPGSVILSLGPVFIPSYARVSRTAFASVREQNFIKSARLMGVGHGRILLAHILPNTAPSLLPALTIGFNNAVLAEASLSYLGIGVRPPDASLGYMLSEAQGMFGLAPWYPLCTGLVMVLLIFGVGLIGEGLQRSARA